MIRKTSIMICAAIASSISTAALAQSAAEIFTEMDSRKRASIEEINDISRLKTMAGMCTFEYHEKASTESTDGRGEIEYMRLVPITEIMERNAADPTFASMSPDELDAMGAVMKDAGGQMGEVFRSEASQAGVPGGIMPMLMSSPKDEPWLSADPADMGGMYATMFEAAADGKRADAAERERAQLEAQTNPFAAVSDRTRVTGKETINGRSALKLITEDVDFKQTMEDGEFTMKTMHLWVDADRYVPLKFQVDGIATQGGESREISIGREDLDFQTYPGCGAMLEPRKSIMTMAGMMTPEQQAEMVEAGKQMAEFEKQIASMPEAQKKMIMRQMGPQLEMMRSMAAGNGFEMVTEVRAMRCNTGTPVDDEYMVMLPVNMGAGCDGFRSSGAAAGAARSVDVVETDLIKMIQLDLVTLGYNPGDADGILSRQTVVAITQFEAANGLEVTGQATPQLAGRLQAAVDAL